MKFAAFISERLRTAFSPGLRRLAGYLPQYKWSVLLALVAMLGAGAASSLIALLLGKLTDIGFYKQESWIIIAAPVGLIFIAALNGGSMRATICLRESASQ